MSEYKCLKLVRDKGPLEYTDLMNKYMKSAHVGYLFSNARVVDLLEKGYLQGSPQAFKIISISKQGRIRIDDLKSERFRYWYPIIISNVLALIAIIVSVVALCK